MPRLYFMDSGETIGDISHDQLQFLVDQLEQEHSEDCDYYISRDTLAMLEEAGCDAALLTLLVKAMGDGDEIDIAWERSEGE